MQIARKYQGNSNDAFFYEFCHLFVFLQVNKRYIRKNFNERIFVIFKQNRICCRWTDGPSNILPLGVGTLLNNNFCRSIFFIILRWHYHLNSQENITQADPQRATISGLMCPELGSAGSVTRYYRRVCQSRRQTAWKASDDSVAIISQSCNNCLKRRMK